jgi:hypothetical protein
MDHNDDLFALWGESILRVREPRRARLPQTHQDGHQRAKVAQLSQHICNHHKLFKHLQKKRMILVDQTNKNKHTTTFPNYFDSERKLFWPENERRNPVRQNVHSIDQTQHVASSVLQLRLAPALVQQLTRLNIRKPTEIDNCHLLCNINGTVQHKQLCRVHVAARDLQICRRNREKRPKFGQTSLVLFLNQFVESLRHWHLIVVLQAFAQIVPFCNLVENRPSSISSKRMQIKQIQTRIPNPNSNSNARNNTLTVW